ncbi:hypothetical protein BDZ91DRAFT_82948 [Kalaharituber pfeilii]|nr:hypothetical protein BDZ91DRAFT_82948 [Kalaharituber pfeilii]
MGAKPHTVLVIGGHGKTAQCIISILLSHGHTVYSLIRNTEQVSEIMELAKPYLDAKLIPLVHDLNGISSHEVQELLAKEDGEIQWVIWAAGAKANIPRHPQDQLSVERDAALKFIDEARGEGLGPGGKVKRFIMISGSICRKEAAEWWSEEDKKYWEKLRKEVVPTYVEAKTEVDEVLVNECRIQVKRFKEKKRGQVEEKGALEDEDEEGYFSAVSVRPGSLVDAPPTGKVLLGRTGVRTKPLPREDLARLVVELCEKKGTKGYGGGIGCRWLDVAAGEEDITEAVERCIAEDMDTSLAGSVKEFRGGGIEPAD